MSTEILRVRGLAIYQRSSNELYWRAGMTIDADGSPRAYHPDDSSGLDDLDNAGYPGNWWALVCGENGKPIVQGRTNPAPGYYVSTTAYVNRKFKTADPRRYLDSEKVSFVVVPRQLRKAIKGVVLGCRAVVTNPWNGKKADAVVGDIGPATHLGEGSIALALALGINSNPRRGGTDNHLLYEIFPGVAAPGFELQPV